MRRISTKKDVRGVNQARRVLVGIHKGVTLKEVAVHEEMAAAGSSRWQQMGWGLKTHVGQ